MVPVLPELRVQELREFLLLLLLYDLEEEIHTIRSSRGHLEQFERIPICRNDALS